MQKYLVQFLSKTYVDKSEMVLALLQVRTLSSSTDLLTPSSWVDSQDGNLVIVDSLEKSNAKLMSGGGDLTN
jgi:hypothetical protein